MFSLLKSPVTLKNILLNVRGMSWYKSLLKPDVYEPPYEHIVQIGDPVLRKVADPVPQDLITTKEINFLVQRMLSAMRDYELVGIASPQIGISLRIMIMEFPEKLKKKYSTDMWKNREMDVLPLTVLINPEMKILNFEKKVFEEGCGSVRGYCGEVARHQQVLAFGFKENGEATELTLNGWNARIFQHELDHLNGILYTDIMDRATFKCSSWEAVNSKRGRLSIPFSPQK